MYWLWLGFWLPFAVYHFVVFAPTFLLFKNLIGLVPILKGFIVLYKLFSLSCQLAFGKLVEHIGHCPT